MTSRKTTARCLKLKAGAYSLPKKNKQKPLGEDACFISDDEQTIGVADGVGSYARYGIDSGVYARKLMENASNFVRKWNRKYCDGVDPMAALNHAFERSWARGASTACIITVKNNTLHAANIGDSGFLVIREGEIVYRSPVQQTRFNCPVQLSVCGSRTPSRDAEEMAFEVEAGDVIVAATDGLFDNVFGDVITVMVLVCLLAADPPEVMAFRLARLGREMSKLETKHRLPSPFTEEAVRNGLDRNKYLGGKYDDVTVIVGCVYQYRSSYWIAVVLFIFGSVIALLLFLRRWFR